jgi:hypothetical protein
MRYLIGFLLLANVVYFFSDPAVDTESVFRSELSVDNIPLVLLNERALVKPEQRAKTKVHNRQLTTIKANEELSSRGSIKRHCLTVGPFFEKDQAMSLADWLRNKTFEPGIRVGEMDVPAGYWVYLPAMPATQAQTIIAQLDDQGISDYLLGKEHMISLGVFVEQSKAATRQEQIIALGYADAELQRYFSTRQAYWLDVEDTEQPLFSNLAWNQRMQETPEITAQSVSCE